VTDAVQTGGQDVEQETAQELARFQGHSARSDHIGPVDWCLTDELILDFLRICN
jgi:hypothetical protein